MGAAWKGAALRSGSGDCRDRGQFNSPGGLSLPPDLRRMDQREYQGAHRCAADALAYMARIAPLSQMDWRELGYGLPCRPLFENYLAWID